MIPSNLGIITKRLRRPPRGQAVVVMVFFLAAFFVGPLSFLAYEISLYNLAKQQLKACVDSAALAAACSQSSNPILTDYATVQSQAEQTAQWIFRQNSILGNLMTATVIHSGAPSSLNAPANGGDLAYQWIDPTTTPGSVVADGDGKGKEIRVYGSYGFVPVFSKFIGLTGLVYPIIDSGNGSLPQLDVVLCFDLSSSMDDFTYVFLVKRFWNTGATELGTTGFTDYAILNYGDNGGPTTIAGQTNPIMSPLGNGAEAMYYACRSGDATGMGLNATWPCNLNSGEPINIYNNSRGSAGTIAQSVATRAGQTKLNHAAPPYAISSTEGTAYTDIIVDVSSAWGISQGITPKYSWSTVNTSSGTPIGEVVEASRGNLEDMASALAAGCVPNNTASPTSISFFSGSALGSGSGTKTQVVPGAGYYNGYWIVANDWAYLNPIGAGALAAQKFFTIINNDADSHFGLVCYNSQTTPSGSTTNLNQTSPGGASNAYGLSSNSEAYPWEGNMQNTPCPYVALDNSVNATNFSTCMTIFQTDVYQGSGAASSGNQQTAINKQLKPNGSTDIAGALRSALQQLMKTTGEATGANQVVTGYQLTRPNSHRAVVLFTDGVPTESSLGGNDITDAKNMGSAAGSVGIPIYCIGLCLTPALQVTQNSVLNDTPNDGIAGRSASQAQYFQATTTNQLITAFEAVARSLVQLVRN